MTVSPSSVIEYTTAPVIVRRIISPIVHFHDQATWRMSSLLTFGNLFMNIANAPANERRFLPHDYPPQFRYYDILVSAFVAVLLISNIVAPKFMAWGPLRLSAAQLLFPLTYIFGDIFTEVYGYAGSRR